MTTIPLNGGGKVVLDDSGYLTWHVDAEDGLGTDVWPLALPMGLVTALGAKGLMALVEALAAAGIGFQIDQPRDREQQRIRAQKIDDERSWGRGGL